MKGERIGGKEERRDAKRDVPMRFPAVKPKE